MNKTFVVNKKDLVQSWYLIDAKGKTLGRTATEIANILRGKNKPVFTPHMDTGDFVIVFNAAVIFSSGFLPVQIFSCCLC